MLPLTFAVHDRLAGRVHLHVTFGLSHAVETTDVVYKTQRLATAVDVQEGGQFLDATTGILQREPQRGQ